MAHHRVDQVSAAVPEEERRAIEGLAAAVYEGISSDLGRCHVSDFYDAFYNRVVPSGVRGWDVSGRGGRRTKASPALESAIERMGRLDPAIERIVIRYMRRHYADSKGML